MLLFVGNTLPQNISKNKQHDALVPSQNVSVTQKVMTM